MFGQKNVNGAGKYRWGAVIPFGVVYFVVGVGLPNPPASNPAQFMWRLAAWLICAVTFAIHIGFEHFRLRNSPSQDGTPRLCVRCTWGICSCRRSEYSRTNGELATNACSHWARDLADPGRAACICGRVGCSCRACPSAIELQCKPILTVWPNVRGGDLAMRFDGLHVPAPASTLDYFRTEN